MGRCDVFKAQPSGTWTRPEYFEEFSQNPDGTISFTQSDQGKHNFHGFGTRDNPDPAPGKLLSIVDRNGNTIRFEYDAAGRLNKIFDTLDREIAVAYKDDGLVGSVTDFAGRQVKYEYYHDGDDGGSNKDLKSVTTPAVTGTPNGNDFPEGKTVIYTYSKGYPEDDPDLRKLNHNLLTITDAKGQVYVRNIYSSTVDPSDPRYTIDHTNRNFDRVVRQVWGNDGDNVDLVYIPLVPSAQNGNAVMRTIVRDRVGNVIEYFFDIGNRLIRKREYTGRAHTDQPTTATTNRPTGKLRSTDPDYFETRNEWDGDSLLTRKVDANGTITEYVYESGVDPDAAARTRANLRETHHLQGGHPVAGDQSQIASLAEYDSGMGGCCGSNFATKETDARGNVTMHEYTEPRPYGERGNLTKTTYPISGAEETFEYNQFGQMTAHVLPDNGSGHKRRDEYVYYDNGPQKGYLQKQIVDAGGLNLTTTYEYDAVGNIVKVTDPCGHDTQYVVNALNQIVRESSREVQVLDNQGNPTGSVRYQRDTSFDADNNVVRVDVQNIDDAGQVVAANPYLTTTYEYEILNNLIRKSEEVDEGRNIVTEYAYDADRNRTLARFGEATAGRQPDNVVQTLYDERNLVYREVRGLGGADESAMQYDYDGNRNQVAVRQGVDADGNTDHVTTSVFDAFNRLVRSVDAMGNVTLYQYDANGNRVLVSVEGELEDVPGDADNLLLSQTHYTFDALNRLTRTDVAFFDTNTQQAIEDGKATTITEYSPNSQVVKTTDDRGNATLTSYESANRRQTVTDAKGNTVTYDYDGNSNVVKITEVEKSDLEPADSPGETFVTVNEYDALDRMMTSKDNLLNTNRSFYDSRNNRARTADALNHEIRYIYDGLNRLLGTIRDMDDNGADPAAVTDGMANPDIVTTQSWDDSSRLTSQTDDNGNTTRYVYDALSRKVGEIYADGTEKRWRFDVHNDNVFWTDANQNQVTQFFDALDRRTDVDVVPGPTISHDTTFEIYKYDGLGRLNYAQDDDSIVTRVYNSLSRMTTETQQYLGETPAVVTSVYDGVGNNTLLYYPSGRVIETTYDSLNRKQIIKDQGDSNFIAGYFYIGPSRVQRRDYGNNTRMDVSYDAARRTTRTRHTVVGPICAVDADCPSGNTCEVDAHTCIIDDRTYAWDPVYHKIQTADVRPSGPLEARAYSYDPVYRLVKSERSDPAGSIETIVYELDGVGNRTRVTGGEKPGEYFMDDRVPELADRKLNQYTRTPFDHRKYDANGNLIEITVDDDLGGPGDFDLADFAHFQGCFGASLSDGSLCSYFDADGDGAIGPGDWALLSQRATGPTPPSRTVAYDFVNRQIVILDLATAGRFEYAYDAVSRRLAMDVRKAESDSPQRYISLSSQEIEESASPGEKTTNVYGDYIDAVLQSRGQVTVYAHGDQLSSVSALTGPEGSVEEQFSYSDFGLSLGRVPEFSSHLFTGRRFDTQSGNYYYRTRYFDPVVGRFTTRDTIGTWGDSLNGGNAFTYVGNNSPSRRDPYGMLSGCLETTLAAGLEVGAGCKGKVNVKTCVKPCCPGTGAQLEIGVEAKYKCAVGIGLQIGPLDWTLEGLGASGTAAIKGGKNCHGQWYGPKWECNRVALQLYEVEAKGPFGLDTHGNPGGVGIGGRLRQDVIYVEVCVGIEAPYFKWSWDWGNTDGTIFGESE